MPDIVQKSRYRNQSSVFVRDEIGVFLAEVVYEFSSEMESADGVGKSAVGR